MARQEGDIDNLKHLNFGETKIEVSGNITDETVKHYINSAVNYISSGSLTKHVHATYLSMRLVCILAIIVGCSAGSATGPHYGPIHCPWVSYIGFSLAIRCSCALNSPRSASTPRPPLSPSSTP